MLAILLLISTLLTNNVILTSGSCTDDEDIFTKIGHKECVPYNISKYKDKNSYINQFKVFSTTTFCAKDYGYWCATSNWYANCHSQSCRKLDPALAKIEDSSIQLNIPSYNHIVNSNNFLLLYNHEFTECRLFYNHKNNEVEEFTRSQYQLCKKENFTSVRSITISQLIPNRKYRLYYVEIKSTENYVIKFNFITKPDIDHVKVVIVRSDGFVLSTLPNLRYTIHPASMSHSNYSFYGLTACKKYCLNITASNQAGSSKSREICQTTFPAVSGLVDVNNINYVSGLMKINLGHYNKTNNCIIKYYAKWYPLDGSIKDSTFTWYTSSNFEITKFNRSQTYCLIVQPAAFSKQIEGPLFGDEVKSWFFTGKKEPNILHFNYSLNTTSNKLKIVWQINEQQNPILVGYEIIVKALSLEFVQKYRYAPAKTKVCGHQITTNLTYNGSFSEFNGRMNNEFQMPQGYSLKVDTRIKIKVFNYFGSYRIYNGSLELNKELPRKDETSTIYLSISLLIFSILFVVIIGVLIYLRPSIKMFFMGNQSNLAVGSVNGTLSLETLSSSFNESECHRLQLQKDPNYDIPIADFHKQSSSILKLNNLKTEFQNIQNSIDSLISKIPLTTKLSQSPQNKAKNRFINILPYDQTMIELPNKEYINANFICSEDFNTKMEYIAAQGPTDTTVNVFWDMLWHYNINIVVMLTKCIENGKAKCLLYWPENVSIFLNFGSKKQFSVSLLRENSSPSYIKRILKVVNKNTNETRLITQLQMIEWNDFRSPDINDFESLLIQFHELVAELAHHPYLVHCSAGVGRTGTFIVIERIVRGILQGVQSVNVFHEVLQLRMFRMTMVQKMTQYRFIYEFLDYFINKFIDINERNIYAND